MDFYKKIFKGQFDLAQRDIEEKRTSAFDAQLFSCFLNAIHGKSTDLEVFANREEMNDARSLLIAWITALSRNDYRDLIDLAETHRDNPVAQWLAGFACLRIRNGKKAEEFYQRCVDLEPANPLFAWSFGAFYLSTSPVRLYQMARWYRKALENGFSNDLLWVIRYLEVFNALQGSFIKTIIFICIWVGLAIYPPTRLIWGGFYVIIMLFHYNAIRATFKLQDVNLFRWLIFRAIIFSVAPMAFVFLWG